MINISLILPDIKNLGPGNRIGIWTSGCHKNCPNCMSKQNKEFSKKTEKHLSDVINQLKEILQTHKIDGVTISGGEPFDQTELLDLVKGIYELGINDILVFTGYKIEELENYIGTLSYISVLIDGPYIEELNDNKPLRGSSNQRIIILDPEMQDKYNEYLTHPRTFDCYFKDENLTVIGILPRGGHKFIEKLIK